MFNCLQIMHWFWKPFVMTSGTVSFVGMYFRFTFTLNLNNLMFTLISLFIPCKCHSWKKVIPLVYESPIHRRIYRHISYVPFFRYHASVIDGATVLCFLEFFEIRLLYKMKLYPRKDLLIGQFPQSASTNAFIDSYISFKGYAQVHTSFQLSEKMFCSWPVGLCCINHVSGHFIRLLLSLKKKFS